MLHLAQFDDRFHERGELEDQRGQGGGVVLAGERESFRAVQFGLGSPQERSSQSTLFKSIRLIARACRSGRHAHLGEPVTTNSPAVDRYVHGSRVCRW